LPALDDGGAKFGDYFLQLLRPQAPALLLAPLLDVDRDASHESAQRKKEFNIAREPCGRSPKEVCFGGRRVVWFGGLARAPNGTTSSQVSF
jgi:hypothetical protein